MGLKQTSSLRAATRAAAPGEHTLGDVIAPEVRRAEITECDVGGFGPGLPHEIGQAGTLIAGGGGEPRAQRVSGILLRIESDRLRGLLDQPDDRLVGQRTRMEETASPSSARRTTCIATRSASPDSGSRPRLAHHAENRSRRNGRCAGCRRGGRWWHNGPRARPARSIPGRVSRVWGGWQGRSRRGGGFCRCRKRYP